MQKINNTWVSDDLYGTATAATMEGTQCFLSVPGEKELDESAIIGCGNCLDSGHIVLSVRGKVPWKDAALAWHSGLLVTDLSYPCPVCNNVDARDLRMGLLSNSGLLEQEYMWQIGFLRQFKGKENALSVAGTILSQLPETRGMVLFFGNNGSGKTGLLKSLVASACRSGVTARYITMAQYLDEIRQSYDEGGKVLANLLRVKMVAIDEVDRRSDTEWAKAEAFRLIDERYMRRHSFCTIMATNLNPDRLAVIYPEFHSRMLDGIMCPLFGEIRGEYDD